MTTDKRLHPEAAGDPLADPAASPRKPNGAVYHGYVVVPDTWTDGWCMGAMSEFEDPDGIDSGDAFVIAPDGSRADLLWKVGTDPVAEILPPDDQRWGVYAIDFPFPVRNASDLASAFRSRLPELKEAYARARRPVGD